MQKGALDAIWDGMYNILPHNIHFLRIAGPILSSNVFGTLHLMSIEWPKRVYFKIPCIDECRGIKLPQMLHGTASAMVGHNHNFDQFQALFCTYRA